MDGAVAARGAPSDHPVGGGVSAPYIGQGWLHIFTGETIPGSTLQDGAATPKSLMQQQAAQVPNCQDTLQLKDETRWRGLGSIVIDHHPLVNRLRGIDHSTTRVHRRCQAYSAVRMMRNGTYSAVTAGKTTEVDLLRSDNKPMMHPSTTMVQKGSKAATLSIGSGVLGLLWRSLSPARTALLRPVQTP